MASFSRHDKGKSLKRLRIPLGLTWFGMVAERLADALWPLFSVVMLCLAALMLGLQDLVAIEIVWGAMLAAAAGAVFGLVFAARRFRLPTRDEALERLDAS